MKLCVTHVANANMQLIHLFKNGQWNSYASLQFISPFCVGFFLCFKLLLKAQSFALTALSVNDE